MIVDDEPAARAQLRDVIQALPQLEIIGEACDGKTAIDAIHDSSPDIVFLDVDMPGTDGFSVAKETESINYQLVFVTAHHEYALKAFETHAIDYLLKPARPSVIEKCLAKILRQEIMSLAQGPAEDEAPSLSLNDGNSSRIIKADHILFIEALGRYRRIHLSAEGKTLHKLDTILSDTTLDSFADQLGKASFIRAHRSYLVNLGFVTSLKSSDRRYDLFLAECEEPLPVARSRVKALKSMISDHQSQ